MSTEGSPQGNRPLGQRYSVCLNLTHVTSKAQLAVLPPVFQTVGAHPPPALQRKPYWSVRKGEDGTETPYPEVQSGLKVHRRREGEDEGPNESCWIHDKHHQRRGVLSLMEIIKTLI